MRTTDEENVNEKIKECCPGQPHIIFDTIPGVDLLFTNPTPHSGLFQQIVKICDGDSYENVLKKLARTSRNIKGKHGGSLPTKNGCRLNFLIWELYLQQLSGGANWK